MKFAKQTYYTISNELLPGWKGGVAIVAEEHYDKPAPDYHEPALQALYLHISLLEALKYRFGENNLDKIKLGVEMTEKSLDFSINAIEAVNGKIPEHLKSYSMIYAIAHAMKSGIDVYAIDTYKNYNGELIGASADARESEIQGNPWCTFSRQNVKVHQDNPSSQPNMKRESNKLIFMVFSQLHFIFLKITYNHD